MSQTMNRCRSCNGRTFVVLRTMGYRMTFGAGTEKDHGRTEDVSKVEVRCAACAKKATIPQVAELRKTALYKQAEAALGMDISDAIGLDVLPDDAGGGGRVSGSRRRVRRPRKQPTAV